jgi:predicted ferric reductase
MMKETTMAESVTDLLQGAGSLVGLMLFSLSLFRRLSFELFLRTHQALAAVCIYMTWRHLPSESIFPRVYIYIPLAILLLSTFLHVLLFLYQNGILPSRTYPYASVMCRKKSENTEESDEYPAEDTPLKIRVALPRPMHVKAGQYVNLWMPSVSFSSWLQCHSFMVTSWSPGRQHVLDLFVQTRHGLTEKLRARAAREGTASFTAFVSGPYGRSEPVGEYESVLAVASGFGIAGVVPYIKRLLYGHNKARRVHLVWQVQRRGK